MPAAPLPFLPGAPLPPPRRSPRRVARSQQYFLRLLCSPWNTSPSTQSRREEAERPPWRQGTRPIPRQQWEAPEPRLGHRPPFVAPLRKRPLPPAPTGPPTPAAKREQRVPSARPGTASALPREAAAAHTAPRGETAPPRDALSAGSAAPRPPRRPAVSLPLTHPLRTSRAPWVSTCSQRAGVRPPPQPRQPAGSPSAGSGGARRARPLPGCSRRASAAAARPRWWTHCSAGRADRLTNARSPPATYMPRPAARRGT